MSGVVIICALFEPQCFPHSLELWVCSYGKNNNGKKQKARKWQWTVTLCVQIRATSSFSFVDQPLPSLRMYLYSGIHAWKPQQSRHEATGTSVPSSVCQVVVKVSDYDAHYSAVTEHQGDLQSWTTATRRFRWEQKNHKRLDQRQLSLSCICQANSILMVFIHFPTIITRFTLQMTIKTFLFFFSLCTFVQNSMKFLQPTINASCWGLTSHMRQISEIWSAQSCRRTKQIIIDLYFVISQ